MIGEQRGVNDRSNGTDGHRWVPDKTSRFYWPNGGRESVLAKVLDCSANIALGLIRGSFAQAGKSVPTPRTISPMHTKFLVNNRPRAALVLYDAIGQMPLGRLGSNRCTAMFINTQSNCQTGRLPDNCRNRNLRTGRLPAVRDPMRCSRRLQRVGSHGLRC